MKNFLLILMGGLCSLGRQSLFAQAQTCPVNINFSFNTLTHWEAYTGNNKNGNEDQSRLYYDSTKSAPAGTINAQAIAEYNLPSVSGIQTITAQGTDVYGGFAKIPTINGYQYDYSVLLGSTSVADYANGNANGGGYVRGISYVIQVPATPVGQPYTMTYAYAMVLENGRHPSNDQPLFSATLTALSSNQVIVCASPKYYLPTIPGSANSNGGNGILDSAAAEQEGFSVSSVLSPNPDPNSNDPNAAHLQDVWTKGWREVTFDLSPYRGQQVLLTFEADNCVPGGHFAYAYVALRNTCSGLNISGPAVACSGATATFSVPSLANATYNWSVPGGWTIVSGGNTNIVQVEPGATDGKISAEEINSCADLKDTIQIAVTSPTIPGSVASDAQVCTEVNGNTLTLSGNRGGVVNWIYSTDGLLWRPVADSTSAYTFSDLTTTTIFKAVVQNGPSCATDTSTGATITVSQKSAGGEATPPVTSFCSNQTVADLLAIQGDNGAIVTWQSSADSVNWQDIVPTVTDSVLAVIGIGQTTYYRAIVKNGVCPADTSGVAAVKLYSTPFPQSVYDPADTTICYGAVAPLSALVSIGTNYTWTKSDSLANPGSGLISSTPYLIASEAAPLKTTNYILNIENNGCPNLLQDTFHINVIPQIVVNAGPDTAVVVGEPLQFNALTNDTSEDIFLWEPPTDLSSQNISNPVGEYGSGIDTITYTVTATDAFGCFGLAKVQVRVFKTLPDIFVPNAFTPGKNFDNIFRPIPVGISSLRFFRVYNRWGQLVYQTSETGQGWDGNVGGKPQDAGTFVWMVQGVDYTGRVIFRKGTMVLIR